MRLCIILSLCLLCHVALGQQNSVDNLPAEDPEARMNQQVDSIQIAYHQTLDSLQIAYKTASGEIDSVQRRLQARLDHVSFLQQAPFSRLNSTQSDLNRKADSVSLRLRSSKIVQALDSIKKVRDSLTVSLNGRIQTVKSRTLDKLNTLSIPPQLKDKVSGITEKIKGLNANVNGVEVDIPGMNRLNSLPTSTVPGANLSTDALTGIESPVGGYSDDLKKIASGNSADVKELARVAEAKATQLSGMNEVKEQTGVLKDYQEKMQGVQNPDSIKGIVKQEIQQVAQDHFAGKEEQLQQAMETLSKYKAKYQNLNSLEDIKRRPPNEMRGKPLKERIIPGLAMQVQRTSDDVMIDFNPYAGYRFSGRITAGAGWNQRVGYNKNKQSFSADARVFGPRIYAEFKLWKGFSPRVEGEVMNTKIPPSTAIPTADPAHHAWIWGAFIGLKKEYKFFKTVNGTALVMTRLFNPDHKSPYADVLNVRFGFEFPMRKKIKTSS